MRWSFVLSGISSFTLKGGFEQQRSRPLPAAETGRRGWGSAPLFQSPAKGLQKKRQAQLVRPAEWSGGQKSPCATATTAASGRSREALLGLRPAGCAAAQGTMQPLGAATRVSFYSARLAKFMKNAQTKTTVRVDGGSVIEKKQASSRNGRDVGGVSGQAPAGSWQNPPT